nr:hypothetical protein [Bradyrhizobium ivorense]
MAGKARAPDRVRTGEPAMMSAAEMHVAAAVPAKSVPAMPMAATVTSAMTTTMAAAVAPSVTSAATLAECGA